MVNERAAEAYGFEVGTRAPMHALEELESFELVELGEAEVVGIARLPFDLVDDPSTDALMVAGPEFASGRLPDGAMLGSIVWLHLHDPDDAADVVADLSPLVDDGDVEVSSALLASGQRAAALQRNGLLIAAAIVTAAGLLAIAQAVGRHLAQRREDSDGLAAIGLTSGGRWSAGLLALAPGLVAGVLAGLAVAVLASSCAATRPGPPRRSRPRPPRRLAGARRRVRRRAHRRVGMRRRRRAALGSAPRQRRREHAHRNDRPRRRRARPAPGPLGRLAPRPRQLVAGAPICPSYPRSPRSPGRSPSSPDRSPSGRALSSSPETPNCTGSRGTSSSRPTRPSEATSGGSSRPIRGSPASKRCTRARSTWAAPTARSARSARSASRD